MSQNILKIQLEKLLEVLAQERTFAKELRIPEMLEVSMEKAELIKRLKGLRSDDKEVLKLAEQVEHENRRNAYLFWLTLNWVRDFMSFAADTTKTPQYTSQGSMDKHLNGGIVLSGKV